jgi:hypothetical protein
MTLDTNAHVLLDACVKEAGRSGSTAAASVEPPGAKERLPPGLA